MMENQWVVKSLAVWGIIITAITTILPALSNLIGVSIAPEWLIALLPSLNENVKHIIESIGPLIGIVMIVMDRWNGSAKKTLVLRKSDV